MLNKMQTIYLIHFYSFKWSTVLNIHRFCNYPSPLKESLIISYKNKCLFVVYFPFWLKTFDHVTLLSVWGRGSCFAWLGHCWGSPVSWSWTKPRQLLTWRQTTWFRLPSVRSFHTALSSPSPTACRASWTAPGECLLGSGWGVSALISLRLMETLSLFLHSCLDFHI